MIDVCLVNSVVAIINWEKNQYIPQPETFL